MAATLWIHNQRVQFTLLEIHIIQNLVRFRPYGHVDVNCTMYIHIDIA